MLIILNSYLIDPASGTEGKRDILIDNGRIVKIEKHLLPPAGASVIDADGMIVCPGLIDTHSHFRDPGFTYKEDLSTGAESAAKGGYTTVILMANTKPPVDSVEILQDILERGRNLPVIGRALKAQPWEMVCFSAISGMGREDVLDQLSKALDKEA